jgi:plasmid stabilization system protein ParE
VAAVVYSRRAPDHLERSFEYLREQDPQAAMRAATAIRSAVSMLADHPLVGRPVAGELRGLVISFGKTGYLAL